ELNDPLLMDAEAYALDSEVAGIDQFDRVAVWARLGARLLDFDYVQPPLSASQFADTSLMLGVVDPPHPALDACVLGTHLERFFAVSVLKGGDPHADPDTAAQLRACATRCMAGEAIRLLDPMPRLDALRPLAGRGGRGPGLRARRRHRNASGEPRMTLPQPADDDLLARALALRGEGGRLHLTLSFLVEETRMQALVVDGEGRCFWNRKLLSALRGDDGGDDYQDSRRLGRAIEPLFNDIADRQRGLFIQDFLLDTPSAPQRPGDSDGENVC